MSLAVSDLMSPHPHLSRIPNGRIDKAHFYGAMAELEIKAHRLQSAETFFRLAVLMDPADQHLCEQLDAVIERRARQDTAAQAH